MARQIDVRCPAHIAVTLVEALRWFVEVNYPRAADECSSAARAALLDLADRFESELVQGGASTYSARIRAFVCQAVKAYLALQEQQTGQCLANRCGLIIQVCRGQSDGSGFAAAAERDAARGGPGIELESGSG